MFGNVLTSADMPVVAFIGDSLGGGEIMLILLVALMLFGSKNLPHLARTIGKTIAQIRRMADGVRDEVMKMEPDSPNTPAAPPPEPPKLPEPIPPKENADDRVAR